MSPFWYTAVQALSHLPSLLVLVIGLVLTGVARRRLPGRPLRLMVAGLGVLLVDVGLGVGVSFVLPALLSAEATGSPGFDVVQLVVVTGLISTLLQPAGLGLVIAAALTGRRTPEPVPATGPGSWPTSPVATAIPSGAPYAGDLPPLPAPAHPAVPSVSGPAREPDR
ncbi:hypothetical protein [Micromonospora musae]|uniref:Uncharacterized protein n=1 Tax=Micromonospora musae TaxID=1894970 RepID=A0A3A9Y6W7_9ACTN|nr:hypothetical protein [Micromonospora musae]RKN33009.1 hypothetical protein D7044_12415 [Micromonospora musae]